VAPGSTFAPGTPVAGLTGRPVYDTTAPGETTTGNLLDKVLSDPGTTTSISSFTIDGTNTTVKPGTPTQVYDPATGALTGTVTVQPDGSYSFTPAPGFTGPVPEIDATVVSSNGQSTVVPLYITVDPFLKDANESQTITAGSGPLNLNLLSNSQAPTGTTTSITSFSLPGSSITYPAGPTPVPVYDPITNKLTGTIVVQPDGSVVFTPASGFSGQVPAITYTVESSDGQTSPGTVAIDIVPGDWHCSLAACIGL
jgi:hypothetical protein